MAVVEVKTVDGSVLEVKTLREHPTVGDVCNSLVSDFGYRTNVRLLFEGQIVKLPRGIDEFPPGSLIIVGARAPQGRPPGRAQRTGGAARQAQPSAASSPPAARQSSVSPSRRQLPPDHITVGVLLTEKANAKVTLHIHKDATVGDLLTHTVAKDPTLHNCRFLFHGHAMDNMQHEVRHYGVGDGATVHAVPRQMTPDMLKLQDARRQLDEMAAHIQRGVTAEQRKGLYEQSMRVLFSLDGLELEGNSRQARKDLVKQLTSFQDSLGVAPAQ